MFGNKICRYGDCKFHDEFLNECGLYKEIKREHKNHRDAGQVWECVDKIARFKSLISVNDIGCWLWEGSYTGQYKTPYFDDYKGCTNSARIAWLFFKGEIEEGKKVKKKCNSFGCINPNHHKLVDKKGQ